MTIISKMAAFFKRKKEEYVEDEAGDYLSITETDTVRPVIEDKLLDVRVFVLDDYENIREILDVIRGEKTMCLIDIHLLRNKDPDELRRAVDKLKKTAGAVDGEIVGFHENWILSAPKNVHIHKGRQ
jgi:SepF-like predicted cell division protein (DUF552 family)